MDGQRAVARRVAVRFCRKRHFCRDRGCCALGGRYGEPVEVRFGDGPVAVALDVQGRGSFRCIGEGEFVLFGSRDHEHRLVAVGRLADRYDDRFHARGAE